MPWDASTTTNVVIAALSAIATGAAAFAAIRSARAADVAARSADRSATAAEAALEEQRRAIAQAEVAAATAGEVAREDRRAFERREVLRLIYEATRRASDQLLDVERTPVSMPGAGKRMAQIAVKEIEATDHLFESELLSANESAALKSRLYVLRALLAQRAGMATQT